MATESFGLDELFGEAEDEMNDTEEDIDDDEETDEEEKEKLKKEISEMKEKMDKMKEDLDKFKDAAKPGVLKSIIEFVGKTVATGVIFYLVNLALGKIKTTVEKSGSGDDKKKYDQQTAKIKALMALQKDVDDLSRVLQTWIVAHQDEQVTLSGIDVPLVDIFNKYTKDMGEKMDVVYGVMNSLRTKDASGKITTSIPSSEQVGQIITGFESYAAILPTLLAFAKEEANKYPTVKSFPLQQSDIDTINTDLDTAKSLPYPG